MLQSSAKAFRLENVLTATETTFYEGTAIAILMEIRSMRVAIGELITELKKGGHR